jgi:hypothetical protein
VRLPRCARNDNAGPGGGNSRKFFNVFVLILAS